MIPFNQRLRDEIQRLRSHLCIGIDITPEALKVSGSDIDALINHSKKIISATHDLAVAYKPNLGFFERFGSKGFQWLEDVIDFIGQDKIIIGDAKLGDIGNTTEQYAIAMFDHFKFSTVTLSPYMGEDSIKPFLNRPGKGVFILCKTSNLSAATLQNQLSNGKTVFEHTAGMAVELNINNNIGLVVGATIPDDITKVRKIAQNLPLLIPGIGAQGGAFRASFMAGNEGGDAIINVSRAINFAGDLSSKEIRKSAQNYVDQMRKFSNE